VEQSGKFEDCYLLKYEEVAETEKGTRVSVS